MAELPGKPKPPSAAEIEEGLAFTPRFDQAGLIGAIVVNAGKSYFTGALPDLWLFALGGLFVFVTIFLPKGIVGTAVAGWNALRLARTNSKPRRVTAPDIGLGGADRVLPGADRTELELAVLVRGRPLQDVPRTDHQRDVRARNNVVVRIQHPSDDPSRMLGLADRRCHRRAERDKSNRGESDDSEFLPLHSRTPQ